MDFPREDRQFDLVMEVPFLGLAVPGKSFRVVQDGDVPHLGGEISEFPVDRFGGEVENDSGMTPPENVPMGYHAHRDIINGINGTGDLKAPEELRPISSFWKFPPA
jgi:hypothetical protein